MAMASCVFISGMNGIKRDPKDQAIKTPDQNINMLFVSFAIRVSALARRSFSCFGISWVRIVKIVMAEMQKLKIINNEKPSSEYLQFIKLARRGGTSVSPVNFPSA